MMRPYRYIVTPEMLEDRDHYMDPDDCDAYMDALEASIVEHMDIERKAEVRAEKQKRRIAELDAALLGLVDAKDRLFDVHCSASTMEELSAMSERTESLWAAARAALRDSGTEGNLPAEEDT
jgi:hypothetical protein